MPYLTKYPNPTPSSKSTNQSIHSPTIRRQSREDNNGVMQNWDYNAMQLGNPKFPTEWKECVVSP